jgi:hypothetical protein
VVQLTFGGKPYVPPPVKRAGAIGKVERYIEATPWQTVGEIAEATGEPASRVSDCLNKLKHEGKAQQEKGIGRSQRSLWAGTSEEGRALREERLPALVAESDARMGEKLSVRLVKALRKAGAAMGAAEA